MPKLLLPVAALAALAAPLPALAQPAGDAQDAERAESAESAPLAAFGERMKDPEQQRETALMLQAMAEVLLDLPIGPLAEAAAEMAGEEAAKIDPQMTLRQLAPDAGQVSDEVARNVPRAMRAAGAMAQGMAAMTPHLRALADRLRDALPAAD